MPPHLVAGTEVETAVESTGRHAHDAFQLAWVRTGMGRVYCRGAVHDAAAGAVVAVPAGEMHHGHSVGAGGWSYLLMDVRGDALARVAEEAGRAAAEPAWVVSRDAGLAAAFARWARCGDPGLEGDTVRWAALVALVCSGEVRVRREPAAVRQAIAFLEAHYAEPVPLERLAAVAGVSRFHLVRAFKRQVGLPPHAYQTQLRVAHAMRMLRGGWSISRAAFATGFAAQSHLHRHFKRVLGITPGQYAARARTLKSPR
ncbi:MAG TPA: AraC family transcriptional regulator [Longimicrobium sp.]|jgi:AraC-like DNA-binding protein